MSKPSKFQLKQMHGFREKEDHHLQTICHFRKIHDVGISDFWFVDALD